MHDAGVILRTAHVARVLERDPRVPGLEEHAQHLLPQLERLDPLAPELACRGALLELEVALLERGAVQVVQPDDLGAAEERPVLARLDALHEEVGDPAGRVHVVGAPALVARPAPELEEVADVVVPDLEVGAAGARALAALVDGDELVVVQLEEGQHALALAVGPADVRAGAAHRRPRAAEPAGPLRAHGVLGDAALHDRLERVVDDVQVAARELRVLRARVEERRRRRAEATAPVDLVQLEHPRLAVARLAQADAHRDAQPEVLGRLDAHGGRTGLVDEQVAVVQRLHAEQLEVEVGGRVDRLREPLEVVAEQALVDAPAADAPLEQRSEGPDVRVAQPADAVALDAPVEHLLVHEAEQDAGREAAEVGVAIDQRACVQHDEPGEVVAADPVVDRASQLCLDRRLVEREVEARARETDPLAQLVAAPGRLTPVWLTQRDRARRSCRRVRARPQQRTLGAVDDVALGDAHAAREDELLLHEVLHLLDRHVGGTEAADALRHAGRDRGGRRRVEPGRDEALAHRALDLRLVPGHDLAGAADQLRRRDARAERVAHHGAAEHEGLRDVSSRRSISAASTSTERS